MENFGRFERKILLAHAVQHLAVCKAQMSVLHIDLRLSGVHADVVQALVHTPVSLICNVGLCERT